MEKFWRAVTNTEWIPLAFELGLALFIIVSFVRCTFWG
jgi:hypothetical protein